MPISLERRSRSRFNRRISLRFSAISFLIASSCWRLFSLTFLRPSRLVVPALILVASSVSFDLMSPILIWTSRRRVPPSSIISELIFLHSVSTSRRWDRSCSLNCLDLSTFPRTASIFDVFSAIFLWISKISLKVCIASNRLISF